MEVRNQQLAVAQHEVGGRYRRPPAMMNVTMKPGIFSGFPDRRPRLGVCLDPKNRY
jgi:hypothetical protein